MNKWECVAVYVRGTYSYERKDLDKLLADGWEPFAVTPSGSTGFYYHLRRNLGKDVEEALQDLRDMIS